MQKRKKEKMKSALVDDSIQMKNEVHFSSSNVLEKSNYNFGECVISKALEIWLEPVL